MATHPQPARCTLPWNTSGDTQGWVRNPVRPGSIKCDSMARRTPDLTGAGPVASWNTDRTQPPRPVQADCSALCSLALDLPKLFFQKCRCYRVQVRGSWVSQGCAGSLWWPWRPACGSGLWLRRLVLLPVLHESVAERPRCGRPLRKQAATGASRATLQSGGWVVIEY